MSELILPGEGNTPPRVFTAMVTPFNDRGRLNRDGVQQLAAHLVANGSDGLVLAGTTGESPALRVPEHLDLFDLAREAVGPNVPLLGGTGANTTDEARYLTASADSRGSVDGMLVVSPYYNRPSQYGIRRYYEDLRQHTDRPVLLYNIPVRTGRAVDFDTVSRLVENGDINGVKDATGNTVMAEALNRRFGNDVALYSGDDSLNLEFARAGAVGAISVASHWAGRVMGRMFEAYFAGDTKRAERLQAALEPSCEFESVHTDETGRTHDTPNPIPAKVMMSYLLGQSVVGDCLPPMIATPQEMAYLRQRAPRIMAGLANLEKGL